MNIIKLPHDIKEYIKRKRKEGLTNFGMLHLFLAVYARAVSQRPGINRFIRGQRIYSRDHLEVMMTIKKETKSVKWTIISFLVPTVMGMIMCMGFNFIVRLFM